MGVSVRRNDREMNTKRRIRSVCRSAAGGAARAGNRWKLREMGDLVAHEYGHKLVQGWEQRLPRAISHLLLAPVMSDVAAKPLYNAKNLFQALHPVNIKLT